MRNVEGARMKTVQEEKLRQARVEVDRRNAVNPGIFIFAKSTEWGFVGETPEELAMNPVPGTWTKPPQVLKDLVGAFGSLLAFVSCPKCKGVSGLFDGVTEVDALGKMSPDFTHQGCDFHRPCFLGMWSDKLLYALSFHDRANSMRIETFYTHADNVSEARMGIPNVPPQDIIGIGLAIGVFVDEGAAKDGSILVAH
jgi:hypothetical protein